MTTNPSPPDWRGLCEELAQQLDDALDFTVSSATRRYMKELTGRARTALAAEADGPAVPEGREPASVVGEPSDEEIMELMPQQMHEDLAAAVRAMAEQEGIDSTPAKGVMRIILNRHIVDLARAVLARFGHQPEPPDEGEAIGPEWQPCVKLPITVHVREQRSGETHVSTREGITPVRPDDLIMRGVQGEEYPIGRELFNKTYRLGTAGHQPAPPAEGDVAELALKELERTVVLLMPVTGHKKIKRFDTIRAALKRLQVLENKADLSPAPAPAGEVAELVAKLRRLAPHNPLGTADPTITRAADLLEQRHPAPVPVDELLAAYRSGAADAAHPTPVPVPAEGEVGELVAWLREQADFELGCTFDADYFIQDAAARNLTRAADLLEQRHPAPVPVSERLPGPEDCDAEGRCWWGRPESDDWSTDWTLTTQEAVDMFCAFSPRVYWLPARALPLPQGELEL